MFVSSKLSICCYLDQGAKYSQQAAVCNLHVLPLRSSPPSSWKPVVSMRWSCEDRRQLISASPTVFLRMAAPPSGLNVEGVHISSAFIIPRKRIGKKKSINRYIERDRGRYRYVRVLLNLSLFPNFIIVITFSFAKL